MRATSFWAKHTNRLLRQQRPIAVGLLFAVIPGSLSCQENEDPSPFSEAELVSEVLSIMPGEPFTVALRISLDAGWHTYWRNPGDAGRPASIDWSLPDGFRTGEIRWPFPSVVEASTVVSFGYDDEVLLLVEVTPPRFISAGFTTTFSAKAHWLVCNNICLPAEADLSLELPIRESPPSPHVGWTEAFSRVRQSLPIYSTEWTLTAWGDSSGYVLEVVPPFEASPLLEDAHFFVGDRDVVSYSPSQAMSIESGGLRITLRKSPYADSEQRHLRGVLVLPEGLVVDQTGARALEVDVTISETAAIPRAGHP